MSYLDELRKFSETKVPYDLSDDELTLHFLSTMSALVEVRLEEMNDWIDETDVKMSEYLRENSTNDSSVHLSIEFTDMMKARVEVWVTTDDTLRRRFRSLRDAYQLRLDLADMVMNFSAVLIELEDDIIKTITKANRYGGKWITTMECAGLVCRDAKAENVMKWFAALSTETINAIFTH